jgi:Kef-type K+ transport system membrane component KefB
MFFLGLELDLNQIKKSWKITFPVAAASITIPGKYHYHTILNMEYFFIDV